LGAPIFAKVADKRLARIEYATIRDQLEVLETLLSVDFELSADDKNEIQEMSLVRNLGLHNRWEVYGRYLANTKRAGYELGELRVVQLAELYRWHTLLTGMIRSSMLKIARDYVTAPGYPDQTAASLT
jgi:hypothetical protein